MSKRPVAGRSARPARRPTTAPPRSPSTNRGARPTTRRPGSGLRGRLRAWPWARLSAAGLLLAVVGGMTWLAMGPALRVQAVTIEGNQWTADSALRRAVASLEGSPLLAVDPTAVAREILAVPGVTGTDVQVRLPDSVVVTVREAGPAILWKTPAVTLLLNPDGVVIGELARTAAIPDQLAGLPVIDDRRPESRNYIRGDQVEPREVDAALRLAAVTGADLGSQATGFSVAIDSRYGFLLLASGSPWTAALGFFGIDPAETPQAVGARIASQQAAIRTLLATRPEAGVSWIDVRDPGRVYFRARG